MSCLMFGPNYYGRFFVDPKDPLSRMTANGETSFMFGSIAAALYIILGICSLPSVAEQMTNAQWQLVYGPVAWSALAMGTAHVIAQGAGVTWDKKDRWAWGLPPITLMSTVFPMAVCGLKVFQMIYCRMVYSCHGKRSRAQMDDSDKVGSDTMEESSDDASPKNSNSDPSDEQV